MRKYKVYFSFKKYKNSFLRHTHIEVLADNQWTAIAEIQKLYSTYYYYISIINVEEV